MSLNKKLYLLGIDGLSFDFINDNLEHLPNFAESFSAKKAKVSQSIFPPDSIPAWITIYTGLSPAIHGVLDSIDYIDEKKVDEVPSIDAFKGKTFWDVLSENGKKVCVINPFLAFPTWDVNGYFVNASVFATNKTYSSNNDKIFKKFKVPLLGGLTIFPNKKDLDAFIKQAISETEDLAEYAEKLHENDNYDLFFVSHFTMDRFQHFLWRYCDNSDLTYPGKNTYQNAILEFYKRFDKIIGDIRKKLHMNESLVIISDHGHGKRCTYALNINELLRRKGYYSIPIKRIKLLDKKYLLEIFKNFVMEIVFKFDLEDLFFKMVKKIPNRKAIKKGKHLKSNNSIAEACDLFGTNPFGGIKINKKNIPENKNYDQICDELIEYFKDYKYKGKKIFQWIKHRNELFEGENKDKFADLLFEMDSDYGVNWSVFCKEVSYNTTHKKISGGHNRRGCFISYNLDEKYLKQFHGISDVYNFVIGFFK